MNMKKPKFWDNENPNIFAYLLFYNFVFLIEMQINIIPKLIILLFLTYIIILYL